MSKKHLLTDILVTLPQTKCPICGKLTLTWSEVPGKSDRLQGKCACFPSGALIEDGKKNFSHYWSQPEVSLDA